MPFTVRRGCRLHYELAGDPALPALLLLRGLGRSSRYWLDVREPLASRFRLVVPDNRGVGLSDAPRPPYTTGQLARDAAAILDHAGIERAHVFGISLGGMIAQRFALDHPERRIGVVLGCTSAGGRLGPGATVRAMLTMVRSATLAGPAAVQAMAPLLVSPSHLARHPEVVDQWARLAAAEPRRPAGLAGQMMAAMTHDASRELHRLRPPVLVLTGDADRILPAARSRALHALIPGATLQLLPGVGHDFPTEAPTETVRAVTEFLLPD